MAVWAPQLELTVLSLEETHFVSAPPLGMAAAPYLSYSDPFCVFLDLIPLSEMFRDLIDVSLK